jgi:hypothetical protein
MGESRSCLGQFVGHIRDFSGGTERIRNINVRRAIPESNLVPPEYEIFMLPLYRGVSSSDVHFLPLVGRADKKK